MTHRGILRRSFLSIGLVLILSCLWSYPTLLEYYWRLWDESSIGRFGIDFPLPYIHLIVASEVLAVLLISLSTCPILTRHPCRQESPQDSGQSPLLTATDFVGGLAWAALILIHDLGSNPNWIATTLIISVSLSGLVGLRQGRATARSVVAKFSSVTIFIFLLYLRQLVAESHGDRPYAPLDEHPLLSWARLVSLASLGFLLQLGTFRYSDNIRFYSSGSLLVGLAFYFAGTITTVSGCIGRASHGDLETAFFSITIEALAANALFLETVIPLLLIVLFDIYYDNELPVSEQADLYERRSLD